MNDPAMRQLTLEMISRSPEIRSWLSQFAEVDQAAATELLLHLRFCTRDSYSSWVTRQLAEVCDTRCAIYAVRRLPSHQISIWDRADRIRHRPGSARGSEDLVMSIIAQLKRQNEEKYLDHPSIRTLRSSRIEKIVFIDDSVGSGDRVASFARRFFQNASVRSWWSYGKIRLHVVALQRSEEGEAAIIEHPH